MALHRIYLAPPASLATGSVLIAGDEAHHAARVRRLQVDDPVEVLDGRGGVAPAQVSAITKPRGQWQLTIEIAEVRRIPPVRPRVEVFSPAPKGPRASELISALSQAGAALWTPLETEHSIADPGEHKLERLERTASEASKQCGRAWLLEIGKPADFSRAIAPGPTRSIVLADASGTPYEPRGSETISLLIGPEGGWSKAELDMARAASIPIARFGPHIMRIEIAAPIASAIILDLESRL
jgi:16S rRNA (uracil1498-N3)-methyltransferase